MKTPAWSSGGRLRVDGVDKERIEEAAGRLGAARNPVALTGAGVSAESGVPTFRGADGLWKKYRPEELATPEAFARDPRLVWEWYDWRRRKVASVKPNPAHYALAGMEKSHQNFTLITQNVDGLHTLAGSTRVLELHGCIWRTRCTGCGAVSGNRDVPLDGPPYCGCGAMLRPDIVWFGEELPLSVVEDAFSATSSADFMMVIGTSSVVQPAASLALRARSAGAFIVEINVEETPLTGSADIFLRGKAAETLPLLL